MNFCKTCDNLCKSEKQYSNGRNDCYIYGCRNNGKIVGWIKNDNELSQMGCSYWKPIQEIEQLTISYY